MSSEKKLLKSALRKLSYRNHSQFELESYLSRKIETKDVVLVEKTIQTLKKMDLIDDQSFASEWAISRANKGKGDYMATRELQQKGVDDHIIESAMKSIPQTTWLESAKDQLNKKKSKFNKLSQYQQKYKMKQYLYQRGFSPIVINIAIDDKGV